jgi:hypothetical protein
MNDLEKIALTIGSVGIGLAVCIKLFKYEREDFPVSDDEDENPWTRLFPVNFDEGRHSDIYNTPESNLNYSRSGGKSRKRRQWKSKTRRS